MREAVAHHHATNPRLVGSVARGDDTGDSDVDILVDFTDAATLLNEVGLRLALTEMLGVEVDVLDANHLPPRMRNRLLAEAVPL
ncbi:nucleotidyltransferase family protein [Dermacoccaceae bacterium W4C1]